MLGARTPASQRTYLQRTNHACGSSRLGLGLGAFFRGNHGGNEWAAGVSVSGIACRAYSPFMSSCLGHGNYEPSSQPADTDMRYKLD